MDSSVERINFDEVRQNAQAQRVDLQAISIFYDALTDDEFNLMKNQGLVTHVTGKSVVARFAKNGAVMFPKKAVGVYCLEAA